MPLPFSKLQFGIKVLSLLLLLSLSSSCTYYFGSSWMKKAAGRNGNLVYKAGNRPAELTREELITIAKPVLDHWADRPLNDELLEGKVNGSRVLMAKLTLQQDVDSVNRFMQHMTVVGNSGSTSFMNKKGDYDFREIGIVGILCQFGDDTSLLYPATADHIVNTLLIETGSKPDTKTPRTLGLMRDTENHILMKEITRYLRNQWMFQHRDSSIVHDNTQNGMDAWFIHHLSEMLETGTYEFNANPYQGYTMSALFTLHSFAANDSVVQLCEQLLDELHWEYALGSYGFRTYRPFRRRVERAGITNLFGDPQGAISQSLCFKHNKRPFTLEDIKGKNYHQVINALVYRYQLPDNIYQLTISPSAEYFVQLGHGYKASPEVISAGPGWLLSGGGVKRGKASQIVPRPITLLLADTASDLNSCFYIPDDRKPSKWNQTGVHHRFAVGRYPVHVPERFSPVAEKHGWRVYNVYGNGSLFVVIKELPGLSLMLLYNDWKFEPQALVDLLAKDNSDDKTLYNKCEVSRHGLVEYDLKAPKNKWVIDYVNLRPVDRNFDAWPRHQGWFASYQFMRKLKKATPPSQ